MVIIVLHVHQKRPVGEWLYFVEMLPTSKFGLVSDLVAGLREFSVLIRPQPVRVLFIFLERAAWNCMEIGFRFSILGFCFWLFVHLYIIVLFFYFKIQL